MKRRKIDEFRFFLKSLLDVMFKGSRSFYLWMSFLTLIILIGFLMYLEQGTKGLVVTNMRDQVSWGFYISNFTFFVGVAAAAVLLVIPAYLYSFKAIKKIVVFGELMAISAIIMALLFISADLGMLERFWHMMPVIGKPNLPGSILAWDMIVLNGYLMLNVAAVLYVAWHSYHGSKPKKLISILLVLISIPWAVGVHTVTAFVYNGLAARPFWNASILAPRFLASAFCSGPALMIIVFQILRKITEFKIEDKAIFKIAEIIAYAMAINLFFLLAEVYKEYYSATKHISQIKYLYQGLHGHGRLVPWIWTATAFNAGGFLLFLIPKTRNHFVPLNVACVLIFAGIWIEKGMGLVVPGFIPDMLGEIVEYMPSRAEIVIGFGIFAFGALIYTLFVRAAIALDTGILRHPGAPPLAKEEYEGPHAEDIMSKRVLTVIPETTVEEISRLLVSHRISGVPVIDKENRIIGVVSESDIIFKEIHHEPHLLERLGDIILPDSAEKTKSAGGTAADIMTSPAIVALEETPLKDLIQIITEKKIKRIIIADKEGHPVGIVSRIDIVKALEKL
jgi:molybdopterin-containing oxidoreductase family membrane subunit